ncbi:hypothetical protein AVEN_110778-1 [Araneus ventricosus]|uniref:Uncharacterized protein n=1 Tax=Araneus ventricosus TaxID=182803 RepID=A0A4Y2L0R0_ARAVE|nr:hypothetical protein AVEN_110778-1 [Araneus ventricosus]
MLKIHSMSARCMLNQSSGIKLPLASVVRKFEEGVPAQGSSASSDRSSKLRGQSQMNPRVASKRDVNKTKLSSTGLKCILQLCESALFPFNLMRPNK